MANNSDPVVTLRRKTYERARFRVLTALAHLEDGYRDLLTPEDVIWLLTQAVADLDEAQINDAGVTVNTQPEGLDWRQFAPFMEG